MQYNLKIICKKNLSLMNNINSKKGLNFEKTYIKGNETYWLSYNFLK